MLSCYISYSQFTLLKFSQSRKAVYITIKRRNSAHVYFTHVADACWSLTVKKLVCTNIYILCKQYSRCTCNDSPSIYNILCYFGCKIEGVSNLVLCVFDFALTPKQVPSKPNSSSVFRFILSGFMRSYCSYQRTCRCWYCFDSVIFLWKSKTFQLRSLSLSFICCCFCCCCCCCK